MSADKHILDNLSTGVFTLDEQLRVRYMNPAAEMMLESSENRSIGIAVTQLVADATALLGVLRDTLDSANPTTRRGLSVVLPSGHEITVDLWVNPWHEGQESSGLIVELQSVDRLLKISREEGMLSAQEATRTVVRGLAHEIKNPLGGVRGAAQLLARALPDESLKEYTSIIIEEADRLKDLVDRMMGPKTQLQLAPVNIHEVAEHVRNLIGAEAGSDTELLRDYDPSLPEIMGDRPQLIQALLNIVRNAYQATEGLEHRRITLRSRSQRQFTIGTRRHRLVCRLDIEDNGPGIPEDLQHAIFVPMISSRADGTGLGLSISQAIVNRHQGLLDCSSEPGTTIFSIYLPMDSQHAE